MPKLTPQHLAELEAMREQLNVMSSRVRDVFLQLATDDETDPCFLAAARLSKVDSGFDVLDALMIDASSEVAASLTTLKNIGQGRNVFHEYAIVTN